MTGLTECAESEPSQNIVRFITFRDHDRIWHRTDSTGFNKVGYITRSRMVIHPRWNRGLTETPFEKIEKQPHKIVGRTVPTPIEIENIETFFTHNVRSIELFNAGLYWLTQTTDLSFFRNPVKLPLLVPIIRDEFERRWVEFRAVLRPADMIAVIDSKNLISRLIARFDHGTWSHVGTYSEKRTIIEAIVPKIVERDVEVYHSPRYRLGVYRATALDDEGARKMIVYLRGIVGSGYSIRKVIRLGFFKALGIEPTGDPTAPKNVSPNDLARSDRLTLIHVV